MNYIPLLLSLCGGIIGVAFRFLLIQLQRSGLITIASNVPASTLLVNVIGSFIAGLLFEKIHANQALYAFFIIGLCGGMTTMSTCALESYLFMQEGSFAQGLLNALLNLGLSICAVYCGKLLSNYL